MLSLNNITYAHPNKDVLFKSIQFSIRKQDKVALVGNNGSGKSTLLKIMAGILLPSDGTIETVVPPYYVPQHFGQFDEYSLARALRIDEKLRALHAILSGTVTESAMTILDDDWSIEERSMEALAHWGLDNVNLSQPMHTLSGGQKTQVFLAGILIHQPEIVLMDEPGNHLDIQRREMLYEYIRSTRQTLVAVSHDRTLLELFPSIYELGKQGITAYGGSFSFYKEQKAIQLNALREELRTKEKALRKARETEREAMERQQKMDARGRKKQDKAGIPTIMRNTLRNNAEKSTAHLKEVHIQKAGKLEQALDETRMALPDKDKMKIGFDNNSLHTGKVLIRAQGINFSYQGKPLWAKPLQFELISGARIAISGANGSGKTTLIKMLLGILKPTHGTLHSAVNNYLYIDQDYSLINSSLTVYQQALQFNTDALAEHEIKSRLTHFLFTKADWEKPCSALSGGEKMRMSLCCLTLCSHPPDILVLDEPTNNLDLQNIDILTEAIRDYNGTVMAISHDTAFLQEIRAEVLIQLNADPGI